jgi:dihydroflavonol-4-reductase
MHVLVTGATGFLGSHVARALARRGDTVRVLRRPQSPLDLLEGVELEHVIGDILDPRSLRDACRRVDAVVHCAAQMKGPGSLAARLTSHVDGTRHLLDAAGEAGVRRFVYTSSVASLGLPPHEPAPTDAGVAPMDETHIWHGSPSTWGYGYAKLRAEEFVRQAAAAGMPAVIVNPALVIGPGDRNRVSNVLIWHMVRGRVPPRIAGGVNVVHIDDIVDGFLGALDRGRAGERYLLCGENRTLNDVIHTTARLLGLRPPRWEVPLGAARAAGEAAFLLARLLRLRAAPELLRAVGRYFYYDGGKARRELGLGPPRPYDAAALASAEWYRARRR